MTPSMLDRHDASWLQDHAHEWVDAGLISPDQAGAIGRYELGESAASSRRLSIGAEVAADLGSMLALMSGAVVISQRWNDMGIAGQVVIGVALAIVGFVSGARLIHHQEPGTTRLVHRFPEQPAGALRSVTGRTRLLASSRWSPDRRDGASGVSVDSTPRFGQETWRRCERSWACSTASRT